MAEFVLYNYFRSSTSYRARIALNLKGIAFDYKPINLLKNEQHSPEYKKINPIGGIPTLLHNGKIIPDSMAIIQYLNDVIPTPAFLPKDPYLKARVIQTSEIINSSLHPMSNLRVLQYFEKTLGYSQEKKEEWIGHWSAVGLSALEENLTAFSGTYSFGDEITMTDILLVPHIMTSLRFKVDMSKYPTLLKINENCLKLEAFAKAHPFKQIDTPEEFKGK
ncbi:Maleylpyruvate isomerase [compost metagenome]